jgi:hypothetical protein
VNHRAGVFLCIALWIGVANAEVPIACQESMRPKKYQVSQDFSGELPIPDYVTALRGCLVPDVGQKVTPAPASAWLESERELYRKVLARRKADLLVIPFQVQGYGLDRIERLLMTADLSYTIAAAGKQTVADPFLVTRALGEGERRIDFGSIESLATQLGARRILLGFVGHDKHHAFTLTLQVFELAATTGLPAKKVWQKDWRAVSFSDEQTPALVLHKMLPDVLRQLPLGIASVRVVSRVGASAKISGSPRTVVTRDDRGGASPELLDLFGALTASTDERSRERAFVRVVVAAWRATNEDARIRFHEAYALMNLERRPGALERLAGLDSPEAVTLRALLDGDLLTAQKSIGSVKQPLERLLLQVSLRDLQFKYEREPRIELSAAVELFGEDSRAWEALVAMRAADGDPWSNGEALVIKQALDAAFPIAGMDVDSLLQGGVVVTAEPPSVENIDIANVRHVRQAAEGIPPTQCCQASTLRPTRWDLLWLLEGLAESRVAKMIYQTIDLQGQMEDALTTVDRDEVFFGGNPLLAAARAAAAGRLMYRSSPDVAKTLSQQIQASALLAGYWAHGQSHLASRALVGEGGYSEAALLLDAYAYDYPRRSYWIDWFIGDERHPEQRSAFTLESIEFSRDDVTPLSQLQPGNAPGHYDAVTANFGTRFAGNPRFARSFRSAEERKAYEADPIPGLREAIEKDPDLWQNYGGLGGCLILFRGDYEGAAKAYMSYPGFSAKASANPVALAFAAYEAGWTLYRAGHWELAEPLLKIAADLDTGSVASLLSNQLVLGLDGDYLGAASAARRRANAYNDVSGYRDYLALLHVLGASADAWKGFSQLRASFDSPQLWVSALVGHGHDGANEKAVRAWLLRPEIRTARHQNRTFAPYYAVLWNSTDRVPPSDLGDLIEQIEGPPTAHIDSDGVSLLVPGHTESSAHYSIQPSPFRAQKVVKLPPGTPIKSKMAYFADAFAALRHGDYDRAVMKFVSLADHYPIEDSPYGGKREAYPLAYFAYAAAKTGDTVGLEAYVGRLNAQRSFDTWLAKAFFAAARKDVEAASAALETAFRNMPFSDDRPVLAEFQYAEACEWLYRDTRDARFLATLLDWAKRHQRIQPTYAWAYSLQYAYEKDPQERRRALAMTYYLDPAAAHIQKASKDEIAQARVWLRDYKPFQPAAPKTPI